MPRIKTQLEKPLSKELVKLSYKVTKMERDDYEEEKIPDTDEEEEQNLKTAWTEFCEAVGQGIQPEMLKAAKEKADADKLFPAIHASSAKTSASKQGAAEGKMDVS